MNELGRIQKPAAATLNIFDENAANPCRAEATLLVNETEFPQSAVLEIIETGHSEPMHFYETEPGPSPGLTFHKYYLDLRAMGLSGSYTFKVTFVYEIREQKAICATDTENLNCMPMADDPPGGDPATDDPLDQQPR